VKKIFFLAVSVASAIIMSVSAFAATFDDVPEDHWAYNNINSAVEAGIMSGMGDGSFGLGEKMTRGQFISMASRLFGWESYDHKVSSIPDNNDTSAWYFSAVEAAAAEGIISSTSSFYPDRFISREEMAAMLVKSLGYDQLAKANSNIPIAFTDVYANKGYIDLANKFGIISGRGNNIFDPSGTALREDAAAMIMRCYERMNSETDFVHGFYAFSSYNQKELSKDMDTVSLGWSQMQLDGENIVVNTLSKNNNEWIVPNGYEDIIEYLRGNGVKAHLNVFMSNSNDNICDTVLNDEAYRKMAVEAIIEELSYEYNALGDNPYDGVTIDFENLKGQETRENFNLFLGELKTQLDKIDKSLYVAVQPKLKSGEYFDGYDFETIGNTADRIIVMAYDYYPSSITKDVMESGFTTTPVTPIDEVYYGLGDVISKTDKEKVVLGMSISTVAWNVKDGKITNRKGIVYSYDEIERLISMGYEVQYSDKYKNPYMKVNEGSSETIIWFENAQSITDKIKLAKMLGINGVSLWRLGIIPDGAKGHMAIWNTIENN